jgi:Sodium/hydrogen exchanger family
MIVAPITIAVIFILHGAVSKPLGVRGIKSAMISTAVGVAVGTSALKLVNIHVESKAAERFVELALVFLLFSDSMRIDLAGLRRSLSWPSPASSHRLAFDDPGRPGCRPARVSRHRVGQRLRSLHDGLLDRRSAGADDRLGQVGAGARAPGARRRKRTERRLS